MSRVDPQDLPHLFIKPRSMFKNLALILCLFATSAQADWHRVAESDDITVYVDASTVKAYGDLKSVWVIDDWKELKSKSWGSYRSSKVKEVYDCKASKWGIVLMEFYPEWQAQGKRVHTYSWEDEAPTLWDIKSDSGVEEVRRIACGHE